MHKKINKILWIHLLELTCQELNILERDVKKEKNVPEFGSKLNAVEAGTVEVNASVRLSERSASDTITVINVVPTAVSSVTEDVAGRDENWGSFPLNHELKSHRVNNNKIRIL